MHAGCFMRLSCAHLDLRLVAREAQLAAAGSARLLPMHECLWGP